MGTAPLGLLSWQHGTLSPSYLNYEEIRRSTSRKHQCTRHLKANHVEVSARKAHEARWYNQSQSRVRDKGFEKLKDGITDLLPINTINSLDRWNGKGLPELGRRKVHYHPSVRCAADSGALFSSADLGANGSYDFKKGKERNGSALYAEELAFVARIFLSLKTLKAFLPNGSWWQAIERQHQRTFNITFTGAMSRLWVLVSPDKLIIGFAFTALVIAALSEITIPHFVAAMIFSAQKGMTNDFYNNARLLVMMSCTYGLFRTGLRSLLLIV